MVITSVADILTYLGLNATATDAQRGLHALIAPLAEDTLKTYAGFSIEQAEYVHFLPSHDGFFDGESVSLDVVNNRVTFDSDGDSDVLFLPERPVRSISELKEDLAAYNGQGVGDFGAATQLAAGTDFYLDYTTSDVSWTGMVKKITGTWPASRRTVKVTYTAGFTAAELDAGTIRGPGGSSIRQLKYAAIMAVAAAFIEATKHQPNAVGSVGAAKSERLADYSITYADESVRNYAMTMQLPPKAKELVDPFRRLSI